MYTRDENSQRRVEKEQQYVKEKGGEALQAVKKVRSGEAKLPSTTKVSEVVARGEKALEDWQQGERAQQLGPKEHAIMEDIQRVLEDERLLLQKNEGDLIQNIVRHGWTLVQGLNGDSTFKTIFDNWHRLMDSIVSGGDVKGLLSSGGELMKTLRDTEEFLDLVSELIDIMKAFIAEKTEEIVEEKPSANVSYYTPGRDSLVARLRGVLSSLTSNYLWCDMVNRGKLVAQKGKAVGEATKEHAQDALEQALHTDNARCLGEDLRLLLQRLAGNMDVDPLFDYTKAAWYDIIHDDELSCVLYELETDMQLVSHNPEMADDPRLKENFKNITSRAEFALNRLKSNPNVLGAKEESRNVVDSIKSDPTNRRLVGDLRKLWDDVQSDKPGEFIDPALLSNLKKVAVPMVLEHLDNVPIPPVHGFVDFLGKYEYNIQDIRVSVPSLIPDDVHIRILYDVDASPLSLEMNHQRTYVFVEVRDIQLHLRNVAWSYTRLSTPHLQDSGFVDIDTQGHGVNLQMKMELKGHLSKNDIIDVLAVRCFIDKWNVKVTDSKHNFIYQTISKMFGAKIRREVQKSIEQKLKEFGRVANDQFITLLQEAKGHSQEATRKLSAVKGNVIGAVAGVKERALNRAQEITASEDVLLMGEEAKQDSKGLVSMAAEKACELLTQQQEKLEVRRNTLMLGRQRWEQNPTYTNTNSRSRLSDSSNWRMGSTSNEHNLTTSASIPPTPPPSPMFGLQDSTASLADSSSMTIPTAEVEYYSLGDSTLSSPASPRRAREDYADGFPTISITPPSDSLPPIIEEQEFVTPPTPANTQEILPPSPYFSQEILPSPTPYYSQEILPPPTPNNTQEILPPPPTPNNTQEILPPPPTPNNTQEIEPPPASLSDDTITTTTVLGTKKNNSLTTSAPWTHIPHPPSLGFEVYPDVPSIAGDDDVRSTASDAGSDTASEKDYSSGEIINMKKMEELNLSNENNNNASLVNEQGTSRF